MQSRDCRVLLFLNFTLTTFGGFHFGAVPLPCAVIGMRLSAPAQVLFRLIASILLWRDLVPIHGLRDCSPLSGSRTYSTWRGAPIWSPEAFRDGVSCFPSLEYSKAPVAEPQPELLPDLGVALNVAHLGNRAVNLCFSGSWTSTKLE